MDSASIPAARLADVLHYVVARTVGAEFGATKLNKAVVAADQEFYRRHGRTITGARSFQKQPFGPVPNGVLKAMSALQKTGAVASHAVMTPSGTRKEFVSLKEPDLTGFSASEIDVINMAIVSLERLSAREASDQTHDSLWEEIDMASQIPVGASVVKPGVVDADTLAWAMS